MFVDVFELVNVVYVCYGDVWGDIGEGGIVYGWDILLGVFI